MPNKHKPNLMKLPVAQRHEVQADILKRRAFHREQALISRCSTCKEPFLEGQRRSTFHNERTSEVWAWHTVTCEKPKAVIKQEREQPGMGVIDADRIVLATREDVVQMMREQVKRENPTLPAQSVEAHAQAIADAWMRENRMVCTCEHFRDRHLYNSEMCREPDCPCKKFRAIQ